MSEILQPLVEWVTHLVNSAGYLGIFLGMLIEAASVPIPSEVIMGLGGFLVGQGKLAFLPVAFLGALGNTIGSLFTYAYGYYGGRPIIRRYGKYLSFDEEKFKRVEDWFEKYGDKTIFICQMLPFVRSIISLPAGILKINLIKFELYTFGGAFIWCLILTYAASLLGENWEQVSVYVKQFETVIIAAVVIISAIWIYRFAKNVRLSK